MAAREIPDDHPPFRDLPVRMIAVAGGGDRLAVNVSGRLASGRLPLICIPGYQRNMADFAAFLKLFRQLTDAEWPAVLLDLRGRGRSTDRTKAEDYASPNDADDVIAVATALGIEQAMLVGQGYGGQVAMMIATARPRLVGATVLVDAGPVSDPRGLVRLRINLKELETLSGEVPFRRITRQILSIDYPAADEPVLDAVALRTHYIAGKGRIAPLFDRRLVGLLEPFDLDDELEPQWQLFRVLGHAPLLLLRSQYTEQLRRSVFEQMLALRRDSDGFEIEGEGSPPLLDKAEDVRPIADFARALGKWRGAFLRPPEG